MIEVKYRINFNSKYFNSHFLYLKGEHLLSVFTEMYKSKLSFEFIALNAFPIASFKKNEYETLV